MKEYTFSEARENFSSVLDEAERNGAVEIRRGEGAEFRLSPPLKSRSSPLDVPGGKLAVNRDELVTVVREGRERSRP